MKLLKKVIPLLLISLLIVGCSKQEKKEASNETAKEKSTVEVKSKILTKDITISKEFLDLAEIANPQESIDELVKNNVIKSGKVNSDGSVTYTMTPSQHKDYMKSLKDSFDESNQDLINDSSNSITDIKYNENLSKFDVYVDPNSYTDFDSFLSLGFYLQGGFYRMFNGDKDASVIVNFINKDTNEILNTADSSELLNSDSNSTSSKEIDVKVEELPYTILEQEPDSLGNVYGKATFKNNSKYPIKYFEFSGVKPTVNETTYFMCTDTVMPGETSSNFEASYENGTVITKISYTYVKDGQDIHVEYDVKLDSYDSY